MKNGIDLHLHLDGSLTPGYIIRQAKKQGISLPAWEEKELLKYMTAPPDCKDLNEYLEKDGSLTPGYIIRQAKKQGISLPAWEEKELLKYMTAPPDCKDLNEYLEKFALPGSVMQTEEALKEAALDVCMQMKEQGLKYVEIRFAPQLHTKKGLTQEQVVNAVLKGLICDKEFESKAILCCMRMEHNEKENMETIRLASKYLGEQVVNAVLKGLICDKEFESKAILCCMRMEHNEKENMETIRLASKYLGKGVVAADLAGAEAL